MTRPACLSGGVLGLEAVEFLQAWFSLVLAMMVPHTSRTQTASYLLLSPPFCTQGARRPIV